MSVYLIFAEARQSRSEAFTVMNRDFTDNIKDAVKIARKFETFRMLPLTEYAEQRELGPDEGTYGTNDCYGGVFILQVSGFSSLGNPAPNSYIHKSKWDGLVAAYEAVQEVTS